VNNAASSALTNNGTISAEIDKLQFDTPTDNADPLVDKFTYPNITSTENFDTHAAGSIHGLSGPVGDWTVATGGGEGTLTAAAVDAGAGDMVLVITDDDDLDGGDLTVTLALDYPLHPNANTFTINHNVSVNDVYFDYYLFDAGSNGVLLRFNTNGNVYTGSAGNIDTGIDWAAGAERFEVEFTTSSTFRLRRYTAGEWGAWSSTQSTVGTAPATLTRFVTITDQAGKATVTISQLVGVTSASIRSVTASDGGSTWDAWAEVAGFSFTAYVDGAGGRWGRAEAR
jgi:hypothetical protein